MSDKTGEKPSHKRVTIKDVAKAADVSPMTVSNVVNGKHQFVGERTRKIVEREIARLNYRVQHSARSLRVDRRHSVGMIFVDEAPSFLDHFNAHVVGGLSNVLSRADYTVTVQGIRANRFSEASIIRNFAVDGFCVVLSGTTAERNTIIEGLVRLDQPLVLIQEPIVSPNAETCVVRQDDAGGGRLIADHLAARRVNTVLVMVPSEVWPAIDERVSGLRQGFAAAGGHVEIDVVRAKTEEFDSARAALIAHLDRFPLPDAIVGANDRLAIAALSVLLDRGIPVPERVKVTGFNGFEQRRYARPLITTVISSAYEMGERAGHMLLERFASDRFPTNEIVLPVHFDLGETT
jgi:DNA-binding LacI/PurR family transcriptional regulator